MNEKHLCPLCGAPNQCAMEGGDGNAENCWCRKLEIEPDAIARVVQSGKEKSCLCEKCASVANEVQHGAANTQTS